MVTSESKINLSETLHETLNNIPDK